MSSRACLTAPLLALLCSAAPQPATAASPLPPEARVLPWDLLEANVGAWAEFALLTGGYATGPFLRISVIGQEQVEGRMGTWVEVWISQQPGSASQVYKVLTVGDPRRPGMVKRALFRWAGGAVNEIPVEELAKQEPRARRRDDVCWETGTCQGQAVDRPPEPVQTPAGTFQARLRELRQDGKTVARVWYTDEVPVLGLVRLDLLDGRGLELIEVGQAARSAISGPVKLYNPGVAPAGDTRGTTDRVREGGR